MTTPINNQSTITEDSNNSEAVEDLSIYLCGACRTPVEDDHEAVLCENCETWFHICCQGIPSDDYTKLNSSSVVWACLRCHSQNYSHINPKRSYSTSRCTLISHLDQSQIVSGDLSIESLKEDALWKHESLPKVKKRTRNKPRPLKLLNANCQSIPSKIGAWRHLLNTHEPDVVVATETWLNPSIFDAELEADDYTIYRRDRQKTIGGGVLIAVHKSINSTELKTNANCKLLMSKLRPFGPNSSSPVNRTSS